MDGDPLGGKWEFTFTLPDSGIQYQPLREMFLS